MSVLQSEESADYLKHIKAVPRFYNNNKWTLFSFLLFLAVTNPLSGNRHSPVVITKTGKVRGIRTSYKGDCMDIYYGIPYAKPPVGDLRFKRTVPVEPWDGISDATKKPPACPQVPLGVEYLDREDSVPESDQSEDCLYLNIWAPCSKTKKAVMVWIHGGNFTRGSASLSLFDGSELATSGGVIVVTISYRLGILGFAASNSEDAPGNAGMFDQAEALKWVHDNIENFEGNSSAITLFGESAGSISVSLHAVSPLTSKLFSRVIMQSGSAAALLLSFTPASNLNITDAVAKAVGCSSSVISTTTQPHTVIGCMRDKDFQTLVNNSAPYLFVPQYGDPFLPKDPRLEIISGKSKNCHRLTGVTADEGSLFWARKFSNTYGSHGEKIQHPTLNKNKARLDMAEALSGYAILPGFLGPIIEHYLSKVQGDNNEEVLRQAYTSFGDSAILCPTVFEAEKVAQQENNVYFYVYDHRQTNTNTSRWLGVMHTAELDFVFGVPLRKGKLESKMNFTEQEKDLSRKLMKIWTNFAKRGSPIDTQMSWPLYSYEHPSYLILDTTESFRTGQGPHRDNCDVFRALYGFLPHPDVGSLSKSITPRDTMPTPVAQPEI